MASHVLGQLLEREGAEDYHYPAILFGENEVSYQELDEQVGLLSSLIASQAPEAELIGISSTRSIGMIAGVLAMLKAGKAYLPLDPGYPPQRLAQIIARSGITVCLAGPGEAALFEELGLQVLEPGQKDNPERPARPLAQSDTAYVLFTSGSTGEPKGVSMGPAPLLNLLAWQQENSHAGIGTRTLQFAALSFDVSFQEIFATLSTGGTLVMIREEQRWDFAGLLEIIDKQRINRLFLPFVALQALAETAVRTGRFPASLQEVMTAGEQLKITPQLRDFFAGMPGCVLFNQYGPTECHVVTQLRLDGDPASWPALPTIGQPIAGVEIVIADPQRHPLPAGETGEIWIGGACLAHGYLNRPDLTQEKFGPWPGAGPAAGRRYRTGDLGRYLPDGNIEFLGRLDDQVKIRGNRVELGEVEAALARLPAVRQAVVVALDSAAGPRLVAYLVAAAAESSVSAVRQALAAHLPDYMVPAVYVWLPELPLNANGKVDKKRLPAPERQRPELAAPYRRPATALEKQLAALWSELLQLDQVGLDDNFFELGGNSLLAQQTVALVHQRLQHTLPITRLYGAPTVAGVARLLAPPAPGARPAAAPPRPVAGADEVAVIGMAGRFPGAATVGELWEVLREGRETTQFFTVEELDASIPEALKTDPLYVRARGILADVEQFDPAFFGLSPKLAALMDPQQRVFLEIAWEALEQSGYLPQQYAGRVGVFAGSGNNSYYAHNVLPNPAAVDQVGSFQVMTANEKDYLASRTAYHLNLKGPAVSVYSACSTSLLAVAQAVQSIRSGQCEVALAGGASVTTPVRSGHLYQEGAMLSRDGHCRAFDADAQGTVFSDGAGVVLLKSLAAARHDGDTIYAVIKGIGVNNDGAGKGSFTAPNAEGQAEAIRLALADGRVAPATISYVEAHGTATPLGDPIEVEGLTLAFGEQAKKQFCAIGSVKSNFGHLTAASGVAGLIKTVLALHHQQLPASLGYRRPNPHIDFAASPFFVNTALVPWQPAGARRAGVSSFGVGGTNVHVVLEEYLPAPEAEAESEAEAEPAAPARPVQLITWSARSASSREAYAQRLTQYLARNPAASLADVAYTLQLTRPEFAHRRFAAVRSVAELQQALAAGAPTAAESSSSAAVPAETVFLFPGQGAQYLGMGRQLYAQEAVFRQAVDACAELLQGQLPADIRTVMYPAATDSGAEAILKNTAYAQPALFVTEYALARLWMSWGIEPTIFCGHSVGEFVAAHLAGVFPLADALRLIAARGRLVSELPRGSMLSVRMPAARLADVLPAELSLAAINGAQLCVVAGPDEHVAAFIPWLDGQGIASRVLETSHAFHSAMMDPVLPAFQALVRAVPLSRPQRPVVSSVSGTWLTDAQATDPDYWTRHLRQTVRFADALDTLFTLEQPLLLEVGPGSVTATLARQQAAGRAAAILPGLPAASGPRSDCYAMLRTLGQLWLHGIKPEWSGFYAGQQRQKVLLPTYAFDRQLCWVYPPAPVLAPPFSAPSNLPPSLPMRKPALLTKVKTLLEEASGIDLAGAAPDLSFLEMGLDSLLLTQVAITLKKEFGLPITFRQLNEEYATPAQLVDYLDQQLPADPAPLPPAPVAAGPAALPPGPTFNQPPAPGFSPPADSMLGLLAQQLQLISQQMAHLQAASSPAAQPAPTGGAVPAPALPVAAAPAAPAAELSPEEAAELKKPFGATARIDRQATELTGPQQAFLQQLTARYTRRTGGSKAYAQQHRAHMADPRVVSGFKPLTKEMVYPLVVNRSAGSRLWDIDGNEYIDALNGFGSCLLGHQPDIIKQALHLQIERGYEVGPQHELAGEVCQKICAFTGFDRAALCNTGSEAVLGAMRMARTVTGRSLIVAFTGSYHGIVDEVLVRGSRQLKSFPAAPGILPEAVQNMLILDYGTPETLRIIRERAHELAAVLVEPVQSRRPEFRPVAFLQEVRQLTAAAGVALIFDEVITGFRVHPGGAQALFGIKADLATYGKVIGGGLPIGAIAGVKAYMDALDGGFWQYGDASYPEVGVTYFAGTFVRHPLALAAANVSLDYLQAQGPALQQGLTARAEQLAARLKPELERHQLPFFVAHFGSLWKIKFLEDVPYSELLFTLMREKGIHIWDGFPCFMTEAHTSAEVEQIATACLESIDELLAAGFLKSDAASAPVAADLLPLPELQAFTADSRPSAILNEPPVAGARLGRDPDGNPAWFVHDPDRPGAYLRVSVS